MQVRRYLDPELFIARAGSFLMRSEVENNLILGICGQPGSSLGVVRGDCYFATVEDAGEVVACAIRTAPHKAVITRAGQEAVARLVDDLAARYPTLPAVLGPEPDVSHFARHWFGRTGNPVRSGMKQRLFEARSIQPLESRPGGQLRLAEEADLSIIVPWTTAFSEEAQLSDPSNLYEATREDIRRHRVFVWDDGGLVSMAGSAGNTERGVRLGRVYTPPQHRRRGYASASVADLTQRLLTQGHLFCCLFTDLANPTSNSIYQRMGYRPVCDMSDFILNAESGAISNPLEP